MGVPRWIIVWIPLFVWEFVNLLGALLNIWVNFSPPPESDMPRPVCSVPILYFPIYHGWWFSGICTIHSKSKSNQKYKPIKSNQKYKPTIKQKKRQTLRERIVIVMYWLRWWVFRATLVVFVGLRADGIIGYEDKSELVVVMVRRTT